ncbi:MAG: nucleoside phosphorylase [Brooklawnia sp.]
MLTPGIWPILDHDDDPADVISPLMAGQTGAQLPARAVLAILGDGVARHAAAEQLPQTGAQLPARAVLAILGDGVARHAAAEQLPQIGAVDLVTASYPIHLAERDGHQVAIVEAPIGAPAAVMVAEYLAARGVRIAVAVGSCGALRDFSEGTFLVPTRALRDEGTSYHYAPPGMWVQTDPDVRAACAAAVAGRGHKVLEVPVWTTDGFYRETPAVIDRRIGQGCAAVEMECAAWSAWARFRGVRFGQILFTADSLAGGGYDPRDFGVDSHEVALRMAIDAASSVAG